MKSLPFLVEFSCRSIRSFVAALEFFIKHQERPRLKGVRIYTQRLENVCILGQRLKDLRSLTVPPRCAHHKIWAVWEYICRVGARLTCKFKVDAWLVTLDREVRVFLSRSSISLITRCKAQQYRDWSFTSKGQTKKAGTFRWSLGSTKN